MLCFCYSIPSINECHYELTQASKHWLRDTLFQVHIKKYIKHESISTFYLQHSVLVKINWRTHNTHARHERTAAHATCRMEFPALKPPQSGAPACFFFFLAEAQETSNFFPNPLTHTLKLVAVRVSENTLVTGNKAKEYFTWLGINGTKENIWDLNFFEWNHNSVYRHWHSQFRVKGSS